MTDEERLLDLKEKITRGMEEVYRKLVAFKKYKNSPLIVSKNGEIVEIKPEGLPPSVKYVRSDQ